jgi:hypothetical protein
VVASVRPVCLACTGWLVLQLVYDGLVCIPCVGVGAVWAPKLAGKRLLWIGAVLCWHELSRTREVFAQQYMPDGVHWGSTCSGGATARPQLCWQRYARVWTPLHSAPCLYICCSVIHSSALFQCLLELKGAAQPQQQHPPMQNCNSHRAGSTGCICGSNLAAASSYAVVKCKC